MDFFDGINKKKLIIRNINNKSEYNNVVGSIFIFGYFFENYRPFPRSGCFFGSSFSTRDVPFLSKGFVGLPISLM